MGRLVKKFDEDASVARFGMAPTTQNPTAKLSDSFYKIGLLSDVFTVLFYYFCSISIFADFKGVTPYRAPIDSHIHSGCFRPGDECMIVTHTRNDSFTPLGKRLTFPL